MRLLNVHSLQFREYDLSIAPRYAIASHRWISGAETTFKDFYRQRNTNKPGYKKVYAFVEYVKTQIPGIHWLWIDTCCIDDRHSQEVSESINSMFRWYSAAEICLAYLADVGADDPGSFERSDWFTRGWTLQELLSPSIVLFLARDWEVIGHKGRCETDTANSMFNMGPCLETKISSATAIPVPILRDYRASSHLGADEKLLWSMGRKTSREEDKWYCLFGILDVSIGANYGEGEERARRRLLKELPQITNFPNVPGGERVSTATISHDHFAQRRVLESLYFPQMYERRDTIHTAYHGTYQWALFPTTSNSFTWDNLNAWLGNSHPENHLYWINAKPGAGKSSLVRFLDEELQSSVHMQPWARDADVIKLTYYFWSSGNAHQKTLTGLLRSALHQLFDELPDITPQCTPSDKWAQALTAKSNIDWTKLELQQAVRRAMDILPPTVRVFVLIDGLDEIDGDDDARDELVDFLKELALCPQLKLCVSSRRWTIFQDSFGLCPQLRLEDLNSHDIKYFVEGQLATQSRFQHMLAYDPSAHFLVPKVVAKADGVFLWTRLVMKDLIRGIRDGDSLSLLLQRLDKVPRDLCQYFNQILESIEPIHRWEASVFLQIVLHEEREFITRRSLGLMDLIFVEHAKSDFALLRDEGVSIRSLCSAEGLVYVLDSTLRRLNSRCKGLVDCRFLTQHTSIAAFDYSTQNSRTIENTVASLLHRDLDKAFEFTVGFMHRSLRDYLLGRDCQQFLLHYTNGPIDARNYLRNARLVQLSMCVGFNLSAGVTVGLASYVICTLSIPSFRATPQCAQFANNLRLSINYVKSKFQYEHSYWYISESLNQWEEEESSFLTLAIDFGLTGYLTRALTIGSVKQKEGRPMLDYALRPRFAHDPELTIGYKYPAPELVRQLLALGANPNELIHDIPIWALFLSSIQDLRSIFQSDQEAKEAYMLSLEAMIRGGANRLVFKGHISTPGIDIYPYSEQQTLSEQELVVDRWPKWVLERTIDDKVSEYVTLEDLLECFRPLLSNRIQYLNDLILEQEGSEKRRDT